MYREKNDDQSKSWKNSYKLLSINDESVIIELSSDSTKFRFTTIKFYYDDLIDRINLELDEHVFEFIESLSSFVELSIENSLLSFNETSSNMFHIDIVSSFIEQDHLESIKRDRDRLRKYFASTAYLSFVFNSDSIVAFAFAFAVVIVKLVDVKLVI
jgi:hypothetical protein